MYKVNTSNPNKLKEFQKYLGEVQAFTKDLAEPDVDLGVNTKLNSSKITSP